MARPTKLTPEFIAAITFAVAGGAMPAEAAQGLGIGRRTWFDWLKRGRAPVPLPGDDLFVELAQKLDQAIGLANTAARMYVMQHAARDVRAAIYLDQKLELAVKHRAAGAGASGPQITFVIEREEDSRGDSAVDGAAERGSDLPRPDRSSGERGPVVERGLGERDGGGVVIDIQGRAIA